MLVDGSKDLLLWFSLRMLTLHQDTGEDGLTEDRGICMKSCQIETWNCSLDQIKLMVQQLK